VDDLANRLGGIEQAIKDIEDLQSGSKSVSLAVMYFPLLDEEGKVVGTEVEELIAASLEDQAEAQEHLNEINNMKKDDPTLINLLLSEEEIAEGFDFLLRDDKNADRFDGEVKGRIDRLNEDSIPFWQNQAKLSEGVEPWHGFTVQMLQLQQDWLAYEQDVERSLDMNRKNHIVIFNTPDEIIADRRSLTVRKIDLIQRDIDMLTLSKTETAPDSTGLPLGSLEEIEEAKKFWLEDDGDAQAAARNGTKGRLDRIDEGIKYLQEVIAAGVISDAAVKLVEAFINNLETEKQYYFDYAKIEIEKDQAFQEAARDGKTPAESINDVLARKKAAREAEKAFVSERLSIARQLLALGEDFFKDELSAETLAILDFELEQALQAVEDISDRTGFDKDPLRELLMAMDPLAWAMKHEFTEREIYNDFRRRVEEKKKDVEKTLKAYTRDSNDYRKSLGLLKNEAVDLFAGKSPDARSREETARALDEYFLNMSRSPPNLIQIGEELYVLAVTGGGNVPLAIFNGQERFEVFGAGWTDIKGDTKGIIPSFQYFALKDFVPGANIFVGSVKAESSGAADNKVLLIEMETTDKTSTRFMHTLAAGLNQETWFEESALSAVSDEPVGEDKKQNALLVIDRIGARYDGEKLAVYMGVAGFMKHHAGGDKGQTGAIKGVLDVDMKKTGSKLILEAGYAGARRSEDATVRVFDPLIDPNLENPLFDEVLTLTSRSSFDFQ
ncbi:MAG: hypothetical protein AAB288_11140, partial [Acidobacteriota bacterium]